jgi:CheY-like chemotaxis protein
VKEPLQVIVADDEQDTVTTLAAILSDAGYEVIEAARGPDVIAAARRRKPDALVLDIDMPGMSGYTVAREIREIYEHNAPLLVAISGKFVGQTDRMLADLAGFTHFLQKPCDPQILLRFLEPLALLKQALPEPEITAPPLDDPQT